MKYCSSLHSSLHSSLRSSQGTLVKPMDSAGKLVKIITKEVRGSEERSYDRIPQQHND